jgi:flagellar assembly protein FliH
MGKILNAEEGTHIVEKYALKPLDLGNNIQKDEKTVESTIAVDNSENISNNTKNSEPVVETNNELVENLLKKSDELSSQLVKMQMQFENQQQEFQKQLAEVKELSYKDGYNEGYNKAKSENEEEIKERLSKLVESIDKVEKVYQEYQNKAENIEKELVSVAMDIAEQVIAKELSKSSKEIALSLTKELINDIKEATKIEIKINPIDYEYVKENLQLEKVKITPDNAITPGGVVILSDSGNIEAEIHERFKTIKENILKG